MPAILWKLSKIISHFPPFTTLNRRKFDLDKALFIFSHSGFVCIEGDTVRIWLARVISVPFVL